MSLEKNKERRGNNTDIRQTNVSRLTKTIFSSRIMFLVRVFWVRIKVVQYSLIPKKIHTEVVDFPIYFYDNLPITTEKVLYLRRYHRDK